MDVSADYHFVAPFEDQRHSGRRSARSTRPATCISSAVASHLLRAVSVLSRTIALTPEPLRTAPLLWQRSDHTDRGGAAPGPTIVGGETCSHPRPVFCSESRVETLVRRRMRRRLQRHARAVSVPTPPPAGVLPRATHGGIGVGNDHGRRRRAHRLLRRLPNRFHRAESELRRGPADR